MGYYNRFDVSDVKINRRRLTPITDEDSPDIGDNITATRTDVP
jgi:hypothetical protein